jgi:hypothetical protein
MKKKIIYWTLMVVLLLLFLVSDKLGSIGILLGYWVGVTMGITNPPITNTKER